MEITIEDGVGTGVTGAGESSPGSSQSQPRQRKQGKVNDFLEKRGFAWLLEVDEQDEAYQKPILEELDVDIGDILMKLRCVILPFPSILKTKTTVVRDEPDFWGPLIVTLIYALVSLSGQFRVLSWILTIWIVGSLIIYLLAKVLGGEVYYSQCLGVIGYCLLPLVIVATLLPFLKSHFYLALFLKILGVIWSTYSAASLLCVQELLHKKPLLLYPIFLLYIYFLSLYTGV